MDAADRLLLHEKYSIYILLQQSSPASFSNSIYLVFDSGLDEPDCDKVVLLA